VLGVPGLIIDSCVESGSVVSPYYDPMLAKIIAWGADREQAAARLARGMRRIRVHGPTTNRDALVAIIDSEPFHLAQTTTAFLDEHSHLRSPELAEGTADRHVIAAALAPALDTEAIAGVPSGWRNVPAVPEHRAFRLRGHDDVTTVSSSLHRGRWHIAIDQQASEEPARQILDVQVALVDRDEHSTAMDLEIDGVRTRLRVQSVGDEVFVDDGHASTAWIAQPRFAATEGQAANMNPQAPVPGTVTAIEVQPGDQVQAGQTLVIVEAMKMEHRITAPTDGRVTQVRVSVGQAVDAHQVLVDVEDVE
jgi:propionyl-CoA carboxylase alpha chain